MNSIQAGSVAQFGIALSLSVVLLAAACGGSATGPAPPPAAAPAPAPRAPAPDPPPAPAPVPGPPPPAASAEPAYCDDYDRWAAATNGLRRIEAENGAEIPDESDPEAIKLWLFEEFADWPLEAVERWLEIFEEQTDHGNRLEDQLAARVTFEDAHDKCRPGQPFPTTLLFSSTEENFDRESPSAAPASPAPPAPAPDPPPAPRPAPAPPPPPPPAPAPSAAAEPAYCGDYDRWAAATNGLRRIEAENGSDIPPVLDEAALDAWMEQVAEDWPMDALQRWFELFEEQLDYGFRVVDQLDVFETLEDAHENCQPGRPFPRTIMGEAWDF